MERQNKTRDSCVRGSDWSAAPWGREGEADAQGLSPRQPCFWIGHWMRSPANEDAMATQLQAASIRFQNGRADWEAVSRTARLTVTALLGGASRPQNGPAKRRGMRDEGVRSTIPERRSPG